MFAFHLKNLDEERAQEFREQLMVSASGGAVIEEHVPARDAAESDAEAQDPQRFELILYALDSQDAEALCLELESRSLEFHRQDLGEVDWNESWKSHHPAIELGSLLYVTPPWDDSLPPAGRKRLVIEPGMAFGLGDAPSTRLAYELMEPLVQEGCRVADVGTGSGILAIAARILGAGQVEAVDIEETAIQATSENAARNGISLNADLDPYPFIIRQGSIDVLDGPFDLIVANIVFEILAPMLSLLIIRLAPKAPIVLGGIRPQHIPDLITRMSQLGLQKQSRLLSPDIAALSFA